MGTDQSPDERLREHSTADLPGHLAEEPRLSRRAAIIRLGTGSARMPYAPPAIALIGLARAEGFGKSGRRARGRGRANGRGRHRGQGN